MSNMFYKNFKFLYLLSLLKTWHKISEICNHHLKEEKYFLAYPATRLSPGLPPGPLPACPLVPGASLPPGPRSQPAPWSQDSSFLRHAAWNKGKYLLQLLNIPFNLYCKWNRLCNSFFKRSINLFLKQYSRLRQCIHFT